MPDVSAEEVWITAREAAQLLARAFGGISRAQWAIATALREGLLSAGAECISVAEGHEEEFVDDEAAKDELLEIPLDVWTRSEHFEADRLKWDWDAGEFDIHNEEWGETYILQGVHFRLADLESLTPTMPIFGERVFSLTDVPSPIAQLRRRGPKPSIRWAALIEAVLKLEREGELTTGAYDGPGALMDRLQRTIPEDKQFDDRTIEPVVSYLFEHLLCGPLRKN